MASQASSQIHFILFPLMAQGHMIPMMDIATILSQHNGVTVTVITTPHNASRFTTSSTQSKSQKFRVIELEFPHNQTGLPEGCENLDMLPSLGTALTFFNAASSLQQPVEQLFDELTPPPNCIISDMCLPYTARIAAKFNIPRISFLGQSCFSLFCLYNIGRHKVRQNVASEREYFVLPGVPDKIEITIAQMPAARRDQNWLAFYAETGAAEAASYGVVMNSFEELEPEYAKGYKKVKNDKVWCIGPVSLSNKDQLDLDKPDEDDEHYCMKWLDLQKSKTVIYACLGSMSNLTPLQLIELGLGLEASNRPFIWVIREKSGSQLDELENWIKEEGFEERIKGRGTLIRGWAPQVLILSHPAIGGFLTHCGWNSTLEAVCGGVPMITWPLFGDQFLNEKLIVQVLGVGVSVGVEAPVNWGEEEEIGVLVKKEDVERAIGELMNESSQSDEMRTRVEVLAEMAKRAMEEGGSSHSNVTLLIQDIMQQTKSSK